VAAVPTAGRRRAVDGAARRHPSRIDELNLLAVVQPPSSPGSLQRAVERSAVLSPDPASARDVLDSAATSPSAPAGPRAFKYGTTKRTCWRWRPCCRPAR
jgi:hypothetical protein